MKNELIHIKCHARHVCVGCGDGRGVSYRVLAHPLLDVCVLCVTFVHLAFSVPRPCLVPMTLWLRKILNPFSPHCQTISLRVRKQCGLFVW